MLWFLLGCSFTLTSGPPTLGGAPAEAAAPDPYDLRRTVALASLDTWIDNPDNGAAQEAVLRDFSLLRDDIVWRWSELSLDQQRWVIDAAARTGRIEDQAFVTDRWSVLPTEARVMLVLDAPLPLGMTLVDAALLDPEPIVRAAGVERLPLPESATRLEAVLSDPDPRVRRIAAERLPLPEYADALAERLADPDPEVREVVRRRLELTESPEPATGDPAAPER